MRLCVHTFFDKNGQPLATGLLGENGKVEVLPLYIAGTGVTIYDIRRTVMNIRNLILKVVKTDGVVITSDFKDYLAPFDLPLAVDKYNVYDVFLPKLPMPRDMDHVKKLLHKVMPALGKAKPMEWQKIAANAAVVYQSMENRGVLVGMMPRLSRWSQRTFTGRSKTLGFNVQGANAEYEITNPAGSPDDCQIHFDWRAADIRVASILSKDADLDEMSINGDPYLAMQELIGDVSRDECKIGLLSAINAMRADNPILDMFPKLRDWISSCSLELENGRPLRSVLNRAFWPGPKVKKRAPFNATMQGSIAHAMQLSIRRVWEELDDSLLAEIHDSLVVTCRSDPDVVRDVISRVVDIMKKPFHGILDDDPIFPVRVSLSKRWKKWEELKVFY